jgi:hypothetical protein
MDDRLWGLNNNGYYTVGYADDIAAILINGKFHQTVSGVLQTQYNSGVKGRSGLSTQIRW